MSDDYAPELEGQRRAEALRAHLEASAAGSNDVSMQLHKPVSDRLRAGQHGIFGLADSPYELGAAAAARAATVGSGAETRAMEPNGGAFDWSAVSDSPAPARRDLRFASQPAGPPAADQVSPLLRAMRERG
jgi:hypothetical protein